MTMSTSLNGSATIQAGVIRGERADYLLDLKGKPVIITVDSRANNARLDVYGGDGVFNSAHTVYAGIATEGMRVSVGATRGNASYMLRLTTPE